MRVVPARNGWAWLVRGFALFRKNPPMWLFLVFVYSLALTLVHKIRYLGPSLSFALLPVFSVSFMVICAVLERGGVLRPALLISGFRGGPQTLILLGILYALSMAAVLGLASFADAGTLMLWFLFGQVPTADAVQDESFANAALIASLGIVPVMMAFWFAPVLVAWTRIGAAQSLFYSFFAVWRNWRPFLVYGAAISLAGFLVLMTVGILAFLTGGNAPMAQSFALVFAFPILFASVYASYRDVFPENAVPAEFPSNAQSR